MVVVVSAVFVVVARNVNTALDDLSPDYPDLTATPGPADSQLPPFNPPADLGANCQYPATTEPASKPANPPRTGRVPLTRLSSVPASPPARATSGCELDNGKSPCTVNSFASLAQQGYFDNTTCHRLTTAPELGVLQCGDPSGDGTGGPGYRFPNEYPTNQYRLTDPALRTVSYPRGTLAMANAGPGTNGSQFFLVYRDSRCRQPTRYSAIDATGLAALDKIAAAGVTGGGDDGKPAKDVTITSARLD